MEDTSPTPSSLRPGEPSELHGLDAGELFARGIHTVRPSGGQGNWQPPTVEEVGRMLPQYRIEKLIGRGGMGAVYKGIQTNLDRPVAIKLLPAEMAADKDFVARFEREARTLAKLQHSRIVTIHDIGRTSEGHLYFVMELVDGTNLREILRGPGLNPEQALAVVGQVCDALQAAHREGIVHRDIKPENVLITHDGYVKLVDFGLARPPQEDGTPNLTQTNLVLGTPEYMAPEQRFGFTKADARSDIFALGVMLYEMLTGQTPRGVFDPPSRKVQVDVRIDEVVLKALQSEPDRRYQKASELKTDVERIRSTPAPKAVEPAPVAAPERRSRRALVLAAVACGALALLAIGWFLFSPKEAPTPLGKSASSHEEAKKSASAPAAAAEPAPVAVKAAGTVGQPTPAESSARDLERILPQYTWWFHNQELVFNPDGTATHLGFSGGFQWSVDHTARNAPTVRLSELGDVPSRALNSVLWFYKDFTGFTNYEYLGKWEGAGTGGVLLGLRLPPPAAFEAAMIDANPLAAQVRAACARAKGLSDALVGYNWSWEPVVNGHAPSVVRFEPDGNVSGGWTWEIVEKGENHFSVVCRWGDHGLQYLVFEPALDSFNSYDGTGKWVAKGQRLNPLGHTPSIAAAPTATPSVTTPTPPAVALVVAATPTPLSAAPPVEAKPASVSPAARRAAQVYDAIVGYSWAWMNIGQESQPQIVDFNWDGRCSGGWTWQPIYKPNGETLIDCRWGDNGHQYLRLNGTCDAFDAFDSQGQFKIKGKRLNPVGQLVNVDGLAASVAAAEAANTPPSKRIEPLLEPCLNAILAPLQDNPQMPRVPVEKLRASLSGDAVKAKTLRQRQIYQYAMAVCEALTNGMDERALTKVAALSSAQVPSLSNGGSIINTMPLRGRDAGRAGEAIRNKQKDERRYADQQAWAYSGFLESSAYKAWIAKSATLRQNVMALYARLMQLEAADAATEATSK